MKTPIIIALSIIGVLGTAGGAMAVNAGTLAGVQQSNLGNAPTSLTPSDSPTPSDDRTEHATPEPGDDNGVHATPEPGDDDGVHAGTPSPSAGHDAGDDHGGLAGGGDDTSGSGSSNSGSGSDDSGSGHGGSGGHGSDD